MKKLITICFLVATTFSAKAQVMNFEETVKYLNEKLACCSGNYKTDTIKVKNDGTITWNDGKTLNLFDLWKGTHNYPNIIEMSNGISRCSSFGIIDLWISASDEKRFGEFKVEADQIRVYKALLHLKSLCTKKKDPFDD